MSNKELNLLRDIAFDFTFYSLVINYAQEDDNNLTNDAILLKNKLTTMIRLIQ